MRKNRKRWAMKYGSLEVATTRRAARVALIVIALCVTIGCGLAKDRKEAEELAEQYFSTIRSGDIEGVLPLYSPQFYEATSLTDWLALLQNQRVRCGSPKSHSLVTWHVWSSIGTSAGVRTTLEYDVQYTSCRMSEKMTIFKPSGGKLQIQGHFLTPRVGKHDGPENSQPTIRA